MRTRFRLSSAVFSAAAIALLAGGCTTSSSTKHAAHWSYEGETGPAHWGSMSPEWSMAHAGRAQSPINLTRGATVPANLPPLRFASSPTTITPRDNGHTVQWDCDGANTLTIGSDVYTLKQFHFHAPSEHTVDGQHYPVEIHFVHANAQGNLAVVGVMLSESRSASEVYESLAQTIPHGAGEGHQGAAGQGVRFNPYALLPSTKTYATYNGSLTTPPCTEGVRWVVLTTPARVSGEQVAAFTEAYYGNARPVQPVNGRLVLVQD